MAPRGRAAREVRLGRGPAARRGERAAPGLSIPTRNPRLEDDGNDSWGPDGPGPQDDGLGRGVAGGAPADFEGVGGVELFDARLGRRPVVLPVRAGACEDSNLAAAGEAVR